MIDMYVVPNEASVNYSMNFTWILKEFSKDHRRMMFQLTWIDPVSISPAAEQDELVFHIKNEAVGDDFLKC